MTARHFETVLTESSLTGTARMVLAVIAYTAGFDGKARVTVRDLEPLVGVTKTAVDRHIAAAVEAGELEIMSTKGQPRVYRINLGTDGAICPPVHLGIDAVDIADMRVNDKPYDWWKTAQPAADMPQIEADRLLPPKPVSVQRKEVLDGLPLSDVGSILRAARVKPDPSAPFYWHRADHRTDAEALVRRMGSLEAVIEHVRAHPPTAPIRRLTQLVTP